MTPFLPLIQQPTQCGLVIYLRQFEGNMDGAERAGMAHQSKGTLTAATVKSQLPSWLLALKTQMNVCDHHTPF